MAKTNRNFIKGKMNKEMDERLLPNGEYIDALNIRIGSTEADEMGVVENAKGNLQLTTLRYNTTALSSDAVCIGAYADSANETLYWFVHDPSFTVGATGKIDLVVSYNTNTSIITYHVVSIDDGGGVDTTLNFNPTYLITGVDMVEDLLFFTDDYNAPRKINVTSVYAEPSANIDQFTNEEILVIKRPPLEAPTMTLSTEGDEDAFMSERFICFAYRYRYEDGEYSATSPFTKVAFTPGAFQYSPDNSLNEGMVNTTTRAELTLKTGSSLVKGIDVLFKEADDSTIKVIEKLDKTDLGIADDADYPFTFEDSKIFTILPASEILRLYDNVPRFAQGQTMMGNRLVYGNYVDGYDLIDGNGNDVQLDYSVELVSEDIGSSDISDTLSASSYTYGSGGSIPDSLATFDFAGLDLVEGALFILTFNHDHHSFTVAPGGTPTPAQTNNDVQVEFTFTLPQSFESVYDLAVSDYFQNIVGTASTIQPFADACDGVTLTDQFNCAVAGSLGAYTKYESGIDAANDPVAIVASLGSDTIGFRFPAIRYVDDITTPTANVYEFLTCSLAEGEYRRFTNVRSLHSNRGYEVAIIYMDDYGRSTTALVSATNTVQVPCENSELQNFIRITIPSTQVAPSWATRYRFAIKPDREGYNTIYSSIFFQEEGGNDAYFLIDGENARKVEEGQRLYVKADSTGTVLSCAETTVLSSEAYAEGDIPGVSDSSSPAGVYMKLNANEFSSEVDGTNIIRRPETNHTRGERGYSPVIALDFGVYGNDESFIPATLPASTRVAIDTELKRQGKKTGSSCEPRRYRFNKTFTVGADYSTPKDWFDTENIAQTLNSGNQIAATTDNVYNSNLISASSYSDMITQFKEANFAAPDYKGNVLTSFWQWGTVPDSDSGGVGTKYYLIVSGTVACGSNRKRRSNIKGNLTLFIADDVLVFETEPQDASPDLFYLSDETFEINSSGEHQGNVQNQDFGTDQSAIVDSGMYNCFTFGNGVESYRVRDSIVGKTFNLGNRSTLTQSQDYKEIRRYADLTYSGVYNQESNVNKLNEFNLGLLNFKPLEQSFGPIQKLFARETDILVLQEDKISYVLAGKNLLSDSVGGGSVASVPEVLGTQIARIEEYGISSNPESFAEWGYDKFFTDVKRGVVIQLTGSDKGKEKLQTISSSGMRTWFRDLFIDAANTQKLGGYDPYSKEYVLSSNDRDLPGEDDVIPCGSSVTYNFSERATVQYTVDLGTVTGDVDIDYAFVSAGSTTVSVIWDGSTYTSGPTITDGTVTFNKLTPYPTTAEVIISATQADTVIELTNNCPEGQPLTVIQVGLSNINIANETIHHQYRYTEGTYTSPTQSTFIQMSDSATNPVVSQYQTASGIQGEPGFPSNESTVRIIANKLGTDTLDFAGADRLMYVRSNILYGNNATDLQTLIGLASVSPPTVIDDGDVHYAEFTMPPNTNQYLYLIWQYRAKATSTNLCYESSSPDDVCCGCN